MGIVPVADLTGYYLLLMLCGHARQSVNLGEQQRAVHTQPGGARRGNRVAGVAPQGGCGAGRLRRLHCLDVERPIWRHDAGQMSYCQLALCGLQCLFLKFWHCRLVYVT